jgi:hypothetical protein
MSKGLDTCIGSAKVGGAKLLRKKMKMFLVGIILLLVNSVAAFAATMTVTNHDDSGPGSLRDAITTAAPGDTIVFELSTPNIITLTTGELLIDKDLTITGPGADLLTVAQGMGNPIDFPVFHTAAGIFNITLSGLTIKDGNNAGFTTSGNGGGLANESSGTVTVSGCTFTDNHGGGEGGGVAQIGLGTLKLTDCVIMGNDVAIGGGGGVAAAFRSGGTVTILRCTISSNSGAGVGGGISNNGSDMTITESTISDNSVTDVVSGAPPGAGGILNHNGTLTVQRCTFANNGASTGSGGAIENEDSMTITNSTFVGNTARDDGGAIENRWVATISDCTITGNTASQKQSSGTVNGGGGLTSAGGTLFNVTTVKNSIIAKNHSPTHPDVAGELISDGYNFIGNGTGGTITPTTGDQIGTFDAPIDPLLGPLADNGGPTQTCALLANSPAINAGDPDAPAMDQRNYDRQDAPDIGAFELGATIPRTLANISTRLLVETGDNVLIGGFVVTGGQGKAVLLRAIGPSLALKGKLANPVLELHNSAGDVIATNDNWQTNSNKQEIIDTGIPPANPLESALLMTLDPGAYTAIVRGVNNGTGIALVEAYDLDRTAGSKLANISTRGLVQTADNVMIGGFIVLGTEDENVIVRAIGPSLPVTGKLEDPILELHDADGAILASNDNWRDTQEQAIEATGIPPTDDAESAIVSTLAPGNYTAIVRGVGNTTGVALVEAYSLN